MWVYLGCQLNRRKTYMGSGLRSVLSSLKFRTKPTPMPDEGRGLPKSSLKNLQKRRSQSLSEQLLSIFFLVSSWGFSCSNCICYLPPFCCASAPLRRTWLCFLCNSPLMGAGKEVPSSPTLPWGSTSPASLCSPLKPFDVLQPLTFTVASTRRFPVCQQLSDP